MIRGAGGVVFDPRGRVLLLRRHNGPWVFPKGHIDPGEEPLDTALREVGEEAGVRASCSDPTEFQTEYTRPDGVSRRISWFIMHTDQDEFIRSEDVFPEGAFLEPAEALERLSFPEDRQLLEQVLRHRTERS